MAAVRSAEVNTMSELQHQGPTEGLNLAVVGAGPTGLALALMAAKALPEARITVFDARPADRDIAGDPRTLALSLGSVQFLSRMGLWSAIVASGQVAAIQQVHVSHFSQGARRAPTGRRAQHGHLAGPHAAGLAGCRGR